METENNDQKFAFVLESDKKQKMWQLMEKVWYYLSVLAFIILMGSAMYATSSFNEGLNFHTKAYQMLPSFWWAGFTALMIGGYALKNICKEMSFFTSMRSSIKYDSLVNNPETDMSSLAKERYFNSRFYVAGYTSLLIASLLISYSLGFHIDYPLALLNESKIFSVISILLLLCIVLVSIYHYRTNRLDSALGAAMAEYYQRKKRTEGK